MTFPTDDREELVASHHAFNGGRLTVRIDTVRQPSGREATREVVEHPPTVVIVPVTRDGDLLLIRQYRHPIGASLLSLPAGAIDTGEDAAAAARRELLEETGYAAERLTPLLIFFTSPGYSTEYQTIFRADNCRYIAEATEQNELIGLVRTPLTELAGLLAHPADPIVDGKTVLALLLLARDLAGSADEPTSTRR